jgi:hypothetical protein
VRSFIAYGGRADGRYVAVPIALAADLQRQTAGMVQ